MNFEEIISIPSTHWKNSDFDKDDEGITHVNIYSKSELPLGRFLSNFAHAPIQYKEIEFASVEAIWYWKLTGENSLISLHGFEAKKKGKMFPVISAPLSEIELCEINWIKINQYPLLKKALLSVDLPLTHYYVMYGRKVDANDYLWTAKLWEKIRTYLNAN